MSANISIEITSKGFPSVWRQSRDTLSGKDMRICGRDGWEHIPIFVDRNTGDSLHVVHEGDTIVRVSLDPKYIIIERIVKIDRDARSAEIDRVWAYDGKARFWEGGKPPASFDDAIDDATNAALAGMFRPRVAGSA